jgi:hypothetical protein
MRIRIFRDAAIAYIKLIGDDGQDGGWRYGVERPSTVRG